MDLFPKIHSIYKRTPKGDFVLGDFARPEVEYLRDCQWSWTEKVDGMNIRIGLVAGDDDGGEPILRIGGRTERAQIPATLLDAINRLGLEPKLRRLFDSPVVLYGEGYGSKIQKGGGNYWSDQRFVLFDVKVGSWWLERADVVDVAGKLGLDVVPEILQGTIDEALDLVAPPGLTSTWGPFQAEGLVGRPIVRLFDAQGERVLVKLKCRDFARRPLP